MDHGTSKSRNGLLAHGIAHYNRAWWNLSTAALYEHAIQRREGRLSHLGPLVVSTGQADIGFQRDPVFGFEIPDRCPGVPSEVLNPRGTWKDASAYDAQAKKLAAMFAKNFAQFADDVTPEVRAAGPVAAG